MASNLPNGSHTQGAVLRDAVEHHIKPESIQQCAGLRALIVTCFHPTDTSSPVLLPLRDVGPGTTREQIEAGPLRHSRPVHQFGPADILHFGTEAPDAGRGDPIGDQFQTRFEGLSSVRVLSRYDEWVNEKRDIPCRLPCRLRAQFTRSTTTSVRAGKLIRWCCRCSILTSSVGVTWSLPRVRSMRLYRTARRFSRLNTEAAVNEFRAVRKRVETASPQVLQGAKFQKAGASAPEPCQHPLQATTSSWRARGHQGPSQASSSMSGDCRHSRS